MYTKDRGLCWDRRKSDELDDDELDEFYCSRKCFVTNEHYTLKVLLFSNMIKTWTTHYWTKQTTHRERQFNPKKTGPVKPTAHDSMKVQRSFGHIGPTQSNQQHRVMKKAARQLHKHYWRNYANTSCFISIVQQSLDFLGNSQNVLNISIYTIKQ